MEENKRISDLFERARNEAPKTSFEEVKKHLVAAGAVGGTGIMAKFITVSFKLKVLIMTTTLSTLTISGILIITHFTGNSGVGEKNVSSRVSEEGQNYEISNENGIHKTVVFDENNQVVKVFIDSSEEAKSAHQKIKLATKKPEYVTKPEHVLVPSVSFKERTDNSANPPDSLTLKKFMITHNTTAEELKNIASQAEDAGIKFKYDARIRRGVIKKIDLTMVLNTGNDKSEWGAKISGSSSFNFEFGWREDETGQALSLYKDCK